MKEVGYMFIINYINTLMGSYLPTEYILTPRRGKKFMVWIAWSSLYMVWFLFSHYVVKFSSVIYPLIGTIIAMAVLLELLYRDSRKRKLAVVVYWFCTGLAADLIGIFCIRFFIPGIFELYLTTQTLETGIRTSLMANLCCGLIIMAEAAIYLCLIRKKQKKLFGAFLLLLAYQFVLGMAFFILCNDFTEQVAQIGLAIEVFCFVVDVMMLYFLESILKRQDVETQIMEQERLRQQEYAYFQAAGRSAEELRMIRHDFSNHLQAVYKMSDGAGNRDTVKEMLEEMSRRIREQGADEGYGWKGDGAVCRK